ncbi:TetR/AcrR family transcriptional regulator [Salipiger sp. 1_MG-2023]|uniref:TetR/AcrR family transcriptional regulator n=1 Tax=Salipiger sp. 1_MG-2023 TaxID=3062665 RepID=UPI0026E3ED2F|nr:TetR/AcrR family transcriptional regulator [Salipiger sp. 1_MG-2023]MDO6586227.1 TetR/AcrR family transcriptional regulator [Salipiger sp. 1_MG-2023]
MARTQGSHSALTGPRIREAALRLFAKHGYAAVSMRQIAAEVGVQAGALYNYTPDKQALLFSLLQGHMDELLDAWKGEPQGDDPMARLECFVRFHIRFNLQRPEAIFISYMELRNLEPENFTVIEGLRKRYEAVLEGILRDGEAAGTFTVADPAIATRALIAMLTGVNTWYRAQGRLSIDEICSIYWQMVRRSVSAP